MNAWKIEPAPINPARSSLKSRTAKKRTARYIMKNQPGYQEAFIDRKEAEKFLAELGRITRHKYIVVSRAPV